MRSPRRARWLICAIALLVTPEALADDKPAKHKALDCVSFDQRDRTDGVGVELEIASSCAPTVSCSIKWELTCAPDTKREKTTKHGVAFELEDGESDGADASAAVCEDESWEIRSITWSCEPV